MTPSSNAGYLLHPIRGLEVFVDDQPAKLTRLSLHDGEARLPSISPRGDEVPLRMRARGLSPSFAIASIDHNRSDDDGWIVRFGLRWHSTDDIRRVGEWLAELRASNLAQPAVQAPLEVIEDRASTERNRSLLRALATLHQDVRMRSAEWDLAGAELPPPSQWPTTHFLVDVRTALVDYHFRIGECEGDGRREVGLMRVHHRREARSRAPQGVRLRGPHPLFHNTVGGAESDTLDLAIVQLSPSRIWCRCDLGRDLLYPGLELPWAEVGWKGGRVGLELRVSHVEDDERDGTLAVLDVLPGSRDLALWHQQATRVCHPHTFIDGKTPDLLYDLYGKSGYFHISGRSPEDFERHRDEFTRFSRRLGGAPRLGSQVTWRSLDGLDGSVTFLNAWDRSTLIYQLAREHLRPLALSGHRALYDLYVRATEHALRQGMEWYVVFVQHGGARFSRLVNRDFPALYDDGRRSTVQPFRCWEIPTGHLPATLEVRTPTQGEVEGWLVQLGTRQCSAYLDALDLVPGRIDFRTPAKRFAAAGMSRGRTLRVATDAGRMAAMATFEHIDDGAHLFGLLDCVRIDRITADPVLHWQAQFALLTDAQEYYRRLGKDRFVFMEELPRQGPKPEERPPVPGAINLGDADIACFRTDLSIELVEQVARAVGRPSE